MSFYQGDDVRRAERFSIEGSAFISFDKKMMPGRVKNVSNYAVCLATKEPMPMGITVDVVIMTDSNRVVVRGYVTRISRGEVVITSSDKTIPILTSFCRKLAV